MIRSVKGTLSGWANFSKDTGYMYRPEKYKDLQEILQSKYQFHYISRGLGRSYGDTALNKQGGIITNTRFNRFLYFDEQSQVLECEAGVTFREIIELFLPRGYALPVTPGTKYVTVGGAIANDVHGKNHHKDGSISNHILDIKLLTSSGEIMTCSRQENQDLFRATIGGIGLTGIILSSRIKLMKVESSFISVDYKKAAHLDEAIDILNETDELYQYSVAWIDCLSRNRTMGRSVLMLGNHASKGQVEYNEPLSLKNRRKLKVPFNLPTFVLNPYSIKAFNSFYYRRFKNTSGVLVDYDSFFYPLDVILSWNRIYGKTGFIQYQVVFPLEMSRQGLTKLLEKLSRARCCSFLGVLKRFGENGNGLLSFPRKGYTLALDIPFRGGERLLTFIRELDELVLGYGGVLYLAKDSLMTPSTFAMMYPELSAFQEIKAKIDPDGLFSSSMARRLNIVRDIG
ncbi:FAD-binding oxidoreductase [Alkalihalobacillus deserti]|uniref:FAD-binding oxidoreductase n=1 Tax=Alkalihalobacillus deserti TaxID=2879466 RepID=UPI001D142463|nr:FAD-binding oxidoreductase [Alkalihalobacillus deserti]